MTPAHPSPPSPRRGLRHWTRERGRQHALPDGSLLAADAGLTDGRLDGVFVLLRDGWRGLDAGGLCGTAEALAGGAHARLARRDAHARRLAAGYGRWAADLFTAEADRLA